MMMRNLIKMRAFRMMVKRNLNRILKNLNNQRKKEKRKAKKERNREDS